MAENGARRPSRIGGLLAVAYLFTLLHTLALLRAVLPRNCLLARLEHRWIDLWIR